MLETPVEQIIYWLLLPILNIRFLFFYCFIRCLSFSSNSFFCVYGGWHFCVFLDVLGMWREIENFQCSFYTISATTSSPALVSPLHWYSSHILMLPFFLCMLFMRPTSFRHFQRIFTFLYDYYRYFNFCIALFDTHSTFSLVLLTRCATWLSEVRKVDRVFFIGIKFKFRRLLWN